MSKMYYTCKKFSFPKMAKEKVTGKFPRQFAQAIAITKSMLAVNFARYKKEYIYHM
jgi:hypothetical protein